MEGSDVEHDQISYNTFYPYPYPYPYPPLPYYYPPPDPNWRCPYPPIPYFYYYPEYDSQMYIYGDGKGFYSFPTQEPSDGENCTKHILNTPNIIVTPTPEDEEESKRNEKLNKELGECSAGDNESVLELLSKKLNEISVKPDLDMNISKDDKTYVGDNRKDLISSPSPVNEKSSEIENSSDEEQNSDEDSTSSSSSSESKKEKKRLGSNSRDGLQAIKSVTDIKVYDTHEEEESTSKVDEDKGLKDMYETNLSEEDDSCSECSLSIDYLKENECVFEVDSGEFVECDELTENDALGLSVIYEEEETDVVSKARPESRGSTGSTLSDCSTTIAKDSEEEPGKQHENVKEREDENPSLVTVRLPLKLSFSKSSNDENVTTVVVGDSEIEDEKSVSSKQDIEGGCVERDVSVTFSLSSARSSSFGRSGLLSKDSSMERANSLNNSDSEVSVSVSLPMKRDKFVAQTLSGDFTNDISKAVSDLESSDSDSNDEEEEKINYSVEKENAILRVCETKRDNNRLISEDNEEEEEEEERDININNNVSDEIVEITDNIITGKEQTDEVNTKEEVNVEKIEAENEALDTYPEYQVENDENIFAKYDEGEEKYLGYKNHGMKPNESEDEENKCEESTVVSDEDSKNATEAEAAENTEINVALRPREEEEIQQSGSEEEGEEEEERGSESEKDDDNDKDITKEAQSICEEIIEEKEQDEDEESDSSDSDSSESESSESEESDKEENLTPTNNCPTYKKYEENAKVTASPFDFSSKIEKSSESVPRSDSNDINEVKVSVRDKIAVFEAAALESQDSRKNLHLSSISRNNSMEKKTLSRNSSIQRSESEFEEDDSGVTDMSKPISETDTEPECFPELKKMSRYQRASTHSRLFKLLQGESNEEPTEEDMDRKIEKREELESRKKIIHNVSITRKTNPEAVKEAETMAQRRERLSLPLKKTNSIDADNLSTSNSPSSPTSSCPISDKLVNELVQSLLLKKKSRYLRNLPMEKLQEAAKRVLEEDLDSLENTSLESTPALTPQEFKSEVPTSYSDYYDTWKSSSDSNQNEYDILPSKAFKTLQEQSISGRKKPWAARCPRVLSSKTINRDLTRVTESPEMYRSASLARSTPEKPTEFIRGGSLSRLGKV